MVQPSYPGVPTPIGYIEKQVAGLGRQTPNSIADIAGQALIQLLADNPGYKRYGEHRWSILQDGGGIWHWTIYVGAVPVDADPLSPKPEPLDPRNLNAAPLPQPGAMDPTDGILPLGTRERKF